MNNEKKLQKKYFSVKVGRRILFVQSYVFVCIFSMIVIQVGAESRKFPINLRKHVHIRGGGLMNGQVVSTWYTR